VQQDVPLQRDAEIGLPVAIHISREKGIGAIKALSQFSGDVVKVIDSY